MGENSRIEWCHHTFNPWRGCRHAELPSEDPHPGCEHCYAEAMAPRNPKTLGAWGIGGRRVIAAEEYWRLPFKWDTDALREGERKRVFCASMADVFEDWPRVMHDHRGEVAIPAMSDVRRRLFEVIDHTPLLDWIILTKRPQNVWRMWPGKYRLNVWLVTSISDQQTANELIPLLLKSRELVPVLGLSAEPLLGPIELWRCFPCGYYCDELTGHIDHPFVRNRNGCSNGGINWLIAGGESGPHARPMHAAWARSLRDQCVDAGVAYYLKQWGEFLPPDQDGATIDGETFLNCSDDFDRVGKKRAGRKLDGREYNEFPRVEVRA